MPTLLEIQNWLEQNNIEFLRSKTDTNLIIDIPRAIDIAEEKNVTFIGNKFKEATSQIIKNTKSKLIFVQNDLLTKEEFDFFTDKSFAITNNPKGLIIEYCKEFLEFEQPAATEGIHSTSIIDPTAKLGKQNQIEANVIIGKNVVIGDHCKIGPGTVIHDNVEIGNAVIIGSQNVIGGVGFGYSKITSDTYQQFPHFGKVIIHSDVHIGNNTCIDRGSLSDTILHSGVRIDNLVHIAHNVTIGKNSLIIAQAMIAGSVSIGENCWIAPCSSIRNGLTIGDNVVVGMNSTVTKNISSNTTVFGSPAIPKG